MLGGRAFGGGGFGGGPVGTNGRVSRGDFGPGRGRDFDPGYGDLPDPKRQRLLEPPIGGPGPFFGGGPPARGGLPGPGFGPAGALAPPGPLPVRREFPVVKLRGLPFRANEVDVVEFFQGLDVVDVLLVRNAEDGKFNGDAFVVFGAAVQVNFALQKNRQHMGRRYVEVFPTKKSDYYKAVAEDVKQGGPIDPPPVQDVAPPRGGFVPGPGGPPPLRAPMRDDRFRGERDMRVRERTPERRDYPERNRAPPPMRSAPPMMPGPVLERGGEFTVVKLRGLPYTASKQDIIEFFGEFGLNEDSLHIVTSADGRSTGEAFAEFNSTGDARRALEKNKQMIGSRYVELFPSSREEATRAATSRI